MTTRDELVSAMQATADEKPRAIKTKKWGTVYIRDPKVSELEDDTEVTSEEGSKKHRIARGAARILCDEQGNRLFDPNNPGDLDLLSRQPWSLLREITQEYEAPN